MILHVLDGTRPPGTVEVEGVRENAGEAAITAVARGKGMKGYAIRHWYYGWSWVPDVPDVTVKPVPENERGKRRGKRDGPEHDVGGEG